MKQTVKCPKCEGEISFNASLSDNVIWVDATCNTCGDWVDVPTDALERILDYFEQRRKDGE